MKRAFGSQLPPVGLCNPVSPRRRRHEVALSACRPGHTGLSMVCGALLGKQVVAARIIRPVPWPHFSQSWALHCCVAGGGNLRLRLA